MRQSKLIEILSKMSTRERSRFREYVYSPFFNKHQSLQKLCDYLLPFAPKFDSPKIDKQYLFRHLFPSQDYNETVVYTYISNLLALLNDFLAYQKFEQQDLSKKTYTIEALHEKGLSRQWKTAVRQHKILQKKHPYQDTSLFYQQYRFYNQLDLDFLSKSRRQYNENLQLKSDALDRFYLASKLRTACDMVSRNAVIKADYECWAIEELVALYELQAERYEQNPVILIYYQILKMLTEGEESYYRGLVLLLEKNLACFPAAELKLMYDYAINYTIRNINTGKLNYYQEFFDLHRILLEKGILLDGGVLTQWDYKNIVTVGLRLKEYDWIERFIWDYKASVGASVRENVFSYNLAAFYYATQQYKEALQLLHRVEFTDSSYHLGAKIIQLKSYYELNELEAGLSLIKTFQSFLKRSREVSEYRKKANLHLIKVARQIIDLRLKLETMRRPTILRRTASIRQQLEHLQPFANLDWVTDILDAMEQK